MDKNLVRLKPINQQAVLVFGASSGIGRDTALRFGMRGAKVVAGARSREVLIALVDEIARRSGNCCWVIADAADFQQVERVALKAVETYGRLDTWVHTAATAVMAEFEQFTPEEFKRVIDVNLLEQAYGAMAALPYLKAAGGGALIHVSSVEAWRTVPFQSAYGASKHGLSGFVQALRVELQHNRVPVSVTEITPAAITRPSTTRPERNSGSSRGLSRPSILPVSPSRRFFMPQSTRFALSLQEEQVRRWCSRSAFHHSYPIS